MRCDPAVQQEAGHRAHAVDFDDKMVSAVGEAFNNVAIHAYGARTGTADLEMEIGHGTVTVRLLDFGRSFNPSAQTSPDLAALPESNMGLYIVRASVDEFSYVPGSPPKCPNVMTLKKNYFIADVASV
jgi:anti-sigma regulatory factor (Ser/Thr protein kinase)